MSSSMPAGSDSNHPESAETAQKINGHLPKSDSRKIPRACLINLVESYKILQTPVALLDSNLNIRYKNEHFDQLVRDYSYPHSRSLINTFARSLAQSNALDLYKCIKSPDCAYTWNGQLIHKTRKLTTKITRVLIVPFFEKSLGRTTPLAWTVFFHDITAEADKVLKKMFISLLEASKLKDNDTGKHIERVNFYAQALANHIYEEQLDPSVDADFVADIGFLAALHDVGKIGTPDDILNKKGPLNDFEWTIMRDHTINGAFILASHPNSMAKQIAQSHHEHWDGSGYPYRLEKDMIPLPARIVAIADVYDALRMRRSYKEAFSHERASQIIIDDAGKHFDPSLVIIFKQIRPLFDDIFNRNMD